MNSFLKLLVLLVGQTFSCYVFAEYKCTHNHNPQLFGASLEPLYAASVFKFRSGTAYYIGGEPGYLLTAFHNTTRRKGENIVCSEVLANYGEQEKCFDVVDPDTEWSETYDESKRSRGALAEWDIQLLKLVKPLPHSVRPLNIGLTAPKVREGHSIFGYPKTPDSTERNFFFAPATFSQDLSLYRSIIGNEPQRLHGKLVYRVTAPQYKGASGAPVINGVAIAWSTATKATSDNNQAIGVPHSQAEFISLLLKLTKPSKKGQSLINGIANDSPTWSRGETKQRLIYALDGRRRQLSNLDILHIGVALRRRGLLFDNSGCLAAATVGSIEWPQVVGVFPNMRLNALQKANIYEREAEAVYAYAVSLPQDNPLHHDLLGTSGVKITQANAYLLRQLEVGQPIAWGLTPSAEQAYQTFSSNFIELWGDRIQSADKLLAASVAPDRVASQDLLRRIQRNFLDASKIYARAHAAGADVTAARAGFAMGSIAIATSLSSSTQAQNELGYIEATANHTGLVAANEHLRQSRDIESRMQVLTELFEQADAVCPNCSIGPMATMHFDDDFQVIEH